MLDPSGRILDFDADFARLVELDPDARGQLLAQAIPGAPPLPSADPVQARLELGTHAVELTCRRSSVGIVGHTLTAVRSGPRPGDLVDQLRVARQTLNSLIDASPLAILTVDRNKRVVMWNRAAERIFGWTINEVLGQPYPIVPDDELAEFERLFERVVFDGQGFIGVEAIRNRKDGSRVEVNMHTAPLHDAEGRVIGGLAMLEDLTEKRQLQHRSRQSQKMEAVGRLAGGIAHDFNNLLTVVLGTGDLLLLEPELSASSRERVEEIIRVGRSARELVVQLMTFSRLQVTRPEQVDVDDRVRAAGRLLARLLGETVDLQLELDAASACVHIDPAQFDQVLVNLVVNARDAMRSAMQGGRVRVRTSVVEREPGGLLSPGRYVCLEVHDDGVGIDADALPHIFEPFFTTKSEAGGTGLGLANVYAIVRHGGGDVFAESQPGVGTWFTVLLPQAADSVSGPALGSMRSDLATDRHDILPRGGERILLVEDNDAVRKSTAKLLSALGYVVETASDGVEVVAHWDRLEVDLVLTDLTMPRMGGAELAEWLRARAPETPVLFMSGNLDVESLRERVEQGCARFLQKPVSLRELAHVIREVLDGAH